MTNENSKIFWREKSGSYLPSLDKSVLKTIIDLELERHIEGVKNGNIIRSSVVFNEHFSRTPQPDGSIVFQKKPGSESIIDTAESMKKVDRQLIKIYGNWISELFVFSLLYNRWASKEFCRYVDFNEIENRFLNLERQDIPEIRNYLIDELTTQHQEINELITNLNSKAKIDGNMKEEQVLDCIREVLRKIVSDEIEENGCEDRWFAAVSSVSSLYLESVGCQIPSDEIDDISDKHFSSWCEPSKDDITRFIDEMVALSVKKLFAAKYK